MRGVVTVRGIRIELLGEVAFESHIKLEEGYRYDVPVDELGIPYVPLVELMGGKGPIELPAGMALGMARPDGYAGLVREATELARRVPNAASWIRALFTSDHIDPDSGRRIRTLKADQVFVAPLYVPEEHLREAASIIESLTRAGVVAEGITGRIRCTIVDKDVSERARGVSSPQLTFGSLEYSLMLVSPTALHAPYENGDKTYAYVSGFEVRRAFADIVGDAHLASELSGMRFTNAYVTLGGVRQLPVPMCMSVVKLDREQLRYRLSPGKDPSRTEQDVTLTGAYGKGFGEHHMTYVRPIVERITSGEGELLDALAAGQVFCGTVYGTDEQLRRLAKAISEVPYVTLGAYVDEGWGTAYCCVTALREDAIGHEVLMRRFDVACVSHTLIYDDGGVPVTRPADLLHEVERALGLGEGGLVLEGAYTGIYTDYADRLGWGSVGPVTRCIQAGSVLRVRTADGQAVDASPIAHAFVGEGTRDGYGEVMAWPATDEYYRVTTEAEPDMYTLLPDLGLHDLEIGGGLVRHVLESLTKAKVEALADVDAAEIVMGENVGHGAPLEVLEMYRNAQCPHLDLEVLVAWYDRALVEAVKRCLRLRGEYAGTQDA